MITFFKVLLIALVIFVIIAVLVLAIGFGLSLILQYIPCELLLYVETGILFVGAMVVAFLIFIDDGE